MTPEGSAATPSPEERLESLRFFAAESLVELPKSLLDWMQEVERQLADFREGNAAAHRTFAKKGPVW